jgi:hypothetical protein
VRKRRLRGPVGDRRDGERQHAGKQQVSSSTDTRRQACRQAQALERIGDRVRISASTMAPAVGMRKSRAT